MDDELLKAKRRVKSSFLGKHGIHGVGVRESEKAVTVHVEQGPPSLPPELLTELKRAAAPFGLLIIRDAPPSIGR